MSNQNKNISYREAGVDIDAGNRTVDLIKEHLKTTKRPEVMGSVGGFGGLFALTPGQYKEPVLISATDGVGTKLKVAFELDQHDTIGIDLVAMCVNDVLVQGAEPLFFLDYLAVGKLIPEKAASIVKGIAEGCRQAGCALIGGETAEMPGLYAQNDYDLAGFAVGIVEREQIIDGSQIKAGDRLIGLGSTGLHSNGYSLARKVLLEHPGDPTEAMSDLDALRVEMLTPTKIYVPFVLPLLNKYQIKGMAHITGGGLIENLPRVLPDQLDVVLEQDSWTVPPIFDLIAQKGPVATEEMYRTFNMGIGFVLVVSPEAEAPIMEELENQSLESFSIGSVVTGTGSTRFNPPLK